MGINFRGVLIFVDFVGLIVAFVKNLFNTDIHNHAFSKPSKSSYLFKPRNFNPSNLNTLTVLNSATKMLFIVINIFHNIIIL